MRGWGDLGGLWIFSGSVGWLGGAGEGLCLLSLGGAWHADLVAEGKPSSRPPRAQAATDASDDGVIAGPGSARATADGRCPRCGGQGVPPRRQLSNPFLMEVEPVVCADCGLDFEQPMGRKGPETMPPWSS